MLVRGSTLVIEGLSYERYLTTVTRNQGEINFDWSLSIRSELLQA